MEIRNMHLKDKKDMKSVHTLATCSNYRDAEAIVDYLADRHFPVDTVNIIADGLTYVEQVTGRLHSGKALLQGFGKGAILGIFFGAIFGLFDFIQPLVSVVVLALWGLVIGGILGAVIDLLAYWTMKGSRDFQSVASVRAATYRVIVEDLGAPKARDILRDSKFASMLEKPDKRDSYASVS